ncbi:MAG: ABC transporter ATP-binding protein [Bacteroidota bacterium]
MKNNILLSVSDLAVEFRNETGWHEAIHGVSFSLERGKTLGIVGESGSGKSVSALSVLRLLPDGISRISEGKIVFCPSPVETYDILSLPEKEMRKLRGKAISMIFQEPMTSLNPVMRCGKQVAEVLRLHEGLNASDAKKRTLALFEEVKLPRAEEMYQSYPHQISGGQKQRVMIAMAMACKPALLIADEPTTALDVTVQKTILELLKDLQERHGISILFISHDLAVVAQLAHHVAVMHNGEVVEYGPAEKIFTNPSHPYTLGLMACRPPHGLRLKRLPTVAEFLDNPEKNTKIQDDSLRISREERKEHLDSLFGQEPVMKVNQLNTWFTRKKEGYFKPADFLKAVDEVSFEIFPGETLGLVGESGCGKTSLGRTMLGLIQARDGQVIYKGRDLMALKERQMRLMRKDLQIIFQDPYSSLNPRRTVGDSIMEPMTVHSLYGNKASRKKRVLVLLEKVGLEANHYDRYPHEFSGGQRQRVCIARALSVDPDFIICDESVSALDISVQAQVLNLLNELKRDFGFTYIFISHDLGVVKYMSDRIAVMKDGKIVEMGEADEVYFNPQTTYTQSLIKAIPKFSS